MENKFQRGDIVWHKKGSLYIILDEPVRDDLLEYIREPFYKYKEIIECINDSDGSSIYAINVNAPSWNRAKSVFEDGRFTFVKKMNFPVG